MDTSETYIKMCEEAREIQVTWIPEGGDFCFNKIDYERSYAKRGMASYVHNRMRYCGRKGGIYKGQIWLPRQDQLQEILLSLSNKEQKNFSHLQLLINIGEWVKRRAYKDKIDWMLDASSEQLTLAFVMEMEYDKTWDGMKWKSNRLR